MREDEPARPREYVPPSQYALSVSTEQRPTSTDSTPTTLSPQHKLVIYLLLVSAFVVMLNETIVSVALPRMMVDLQIEPAVGQWLVTAFMLTMAIVIPLTGFLMRRFSTRTLYLGAMALFVVGTALASLSPMFGELTFGVLIVARVIQAAGTGVMTPLLMTTIMTLVPPHERGRMMGNISIVMAAAPVVGPLLGGIIVSSLPWWCIFVIVFPVAVGAFVLGFAKLTNVTTTERIKIDVLSVILSAFAFGGLVYGLSEFGTEAQAQLDPGARATELSPWIPFIVGLVALVGWVFRQLALQKAGSALIDLRVFANSGFTRAIIMMAVMNLILFGSLVLLPFYIQTGLGLGPIESALIVLPGGLLMGVAGPFVGAWYDKVGPRPLVIPGAAIVTVALTLMAIFFGETTPWWAVSVLYLVLCIGLALQFGPLFTASLGSLTPRLYSYGSATVGTLQQLAGAAGTSLFIVIFTLTMVQFLSGVHGSPTATDTAHAYVAGTRAAIAVGAFASVIPIVLGFFVKRPANEMGGAPTPMH